MTIFKKGIHGFFLNFAANFTLKTNIAMDFNKMFKNTIYSLLAAFTLMLMPCVGASAQQQTDINKPTRERSKNNDKKSASTKKDDKKNDKKDNKQD